MAEPLLEVQDVIAAKIEATSGTAEALTATEGVFNVLNPVFDDEIAENERMGQSSSSRLPSVPGTRSASIKFSIEACGLGSAGDVPVWADTFLPACGWVKTGSVFSPVTGSTSQKSLTFGKYEDGVLRVAAGCRGTFTVDASEVGKPVLFNFDFKGVLQDDSDVALIAPTYPTTIPPAWLGSTITLGSYTPLISKFSVAANNELYLRPDPAVAQGYRNCVIVDRNPTCTLNPEATLVATRNWQTLIKSSTQEALSIAIGTVTHNIVTIGAPKAQAVKGNSVADNKIRRRDVMLRLCRSAAAGDDDLTITFG
jgi:hypothetical protein